MLKSKKAFCWIFLISMCKSIGDFIFAESFRDHESQLRCWPRPQQGLEVKTSGVGGICWWRWSFRWIFWGFARCFDDVCRWNNHLKHYDHLAFFGQLWHVFSLKFETSLFPSLFTWSFRWLCCGMSHYVPACSAALQNGLWSADFSQGTCGCFLHLLLL